MLESYIKDYQINLLENVYHDDLERLKAITYGLEHVLNSIENNTETENDTYTINKITTCLITLKEIVKEYDEKESLPF